MNVTGMNDAEQLPPPFLQLNEDRPFQGIIAMCLKFFIKISGKIFSQN